MMASLTASTGVMKKKLPSRRQILTMQPKIQPKIGLRRYINHVQTKQVEVASLCRIKEELNNSQNKLKSSLVQLDKDNTELNELCISLKEEHNSLVKVRNRTIYQLECFLFQLKKLCLI